MHLRFEAAQEDFGTFVDKHIADYFASAHDPDACAPDLLNALLGHAPTHLRQAVRTQFLDSNEEIRGDVDCHDITRFVDDLPPCQNTSPTIPSDMTETPTDLREIITSRAAAQVTTNPVAPAPCVPINALPLENPQLPPPPTAANPNNPPNPRPPPRQGLSCFRCGKCGHTSVNCRAPTHTILRFRAQSEKQPSSSADKTTRKSIATLLAKVDEMQRATAAFLENISTTTSPSPSSTTIPSIQELTQTEAQRHVQEMMKSGNQ